MCINLSATEVLLLLLLLCCTFWDVPSTTAVDLPRETCLLLEIVLLYLSLVFVASKCWHDPSQRLRRPQGPIPSQFPRVSAERLAGTAAAAALAAAAHDRRPGGAVDRWCSCSSTEEAVGKNNGDDAGSSCGRCK